MSRLVRFNRLWLVSERDRRGRELSFGPKTVLLGPNGTGKSRVSKSFYWCLGCEPPMRNAGNWDPATVGALEFSINEDTYYAVRKHRAIGLFSEDRRLLFATNKNSEWVERINRLFAYSVRLQRPGAGEFAPAGMDYMSLPFYVDQDASWGSDWATYENLSQFSRWKETVFATFTGLRPRAYLLAKQRKDDVDRRLKLKQAELDAQRISFRRVRETLPKETASLDVRTFRAELADLAKTAQAAHFRQHKVREDLVSVVNQRQSLEAKLKLASAAQQDLGGDFKYLSSLPEGSEIECPTCGVLHATSFHARLSLGQDLEEMSELVAQLSDSLEQCTLKEAVLRRELRAIERTVEEYEREIAASRSRSRLDDVLAAHSKRILDEAFGKVESALSAEVAVAERALNAVLSELKRYEDKQRKKDVAGFYSAQLRRLSDALHIPANERVEDTAIGKRPSTGGSSGRRAILAVHLALLACNAEFGDTAMLPVVIDTLQQSGQDDPNLGGMFNVVAQSIDNTHQLVIAVERLPVEADTSSFDVKRFSGLGGLLLHEEFENVAATVGPMLSQMLTRIEEQAGS